MLTCLPESLCSWNYRITGAASDAGVTFNRLSEQGTIRLDGGEERAVVRKQWPGRAPATPRDV